MSVKDYMISYFSLKSEKAMMRFNEIIRIISGDEVAVSLLNTLIDSIERYFYTVVRMETKLKVLRFRLEADALQSLTIDLDRQRHLAHEALISNLHIFNRYILKEFDEVPVGGIFSEDPTMIRDRIAVADWSGKLLCALFANRKR